MHTAQHNIEWLLSVLNIVLMSEATFHIGAVCMRVHDENGEMNVEK